MKEKLKDLIHSKYFIPILCCIPLAALVLAIVFPILWYLFLGELTFVLLGLIKLHWRAFLAIPGVIFGFFAVLRYVIPIVIFFFSKISTYLSLWRFCIRNGYQLKITRMPFCSLFGVKEQPDLCITTEKGVYCIHFIDIVFRFRRVILFDGEGRYHITPTTATGATLVGAALGSVFSDEPVELTNQKKVLLNIASARKGKIPDFSGDKKRRHIIMLRTNPVDARYDN